MNRFSVKKSLLCGLTMALALPVTSCISINVRPTQYRYFDTPAADDAWSPQITAWQARDNVPHPPESDLPSVEDTLLNSGWEKREIPKQSTDTVGIEEIRNVSPQSTAEPTSTTGEERSLREKYEDFQIERKRHTAREFMEWIQAQALGGHYIADGRVDHWATLEETLRTDGDDCDGLEVLVFHALRDQGFGEDEVFHAIIHRLSDGQHHMVTLWFEDINDPWVIDPTGAVSSSMQKMSSFPEWVPLKIFGEEVEYSVRPELYQQRSERGR